MIDLLAERILTREEFLDQKVKLKDRQYELSELIKTYDKKDDRFSKKLADLINITTNAYDHFKGSNIDEKREFLNFLFSNLELKGANLHYTLRFPFDQLEKVAACTEWGEQRGSNPRPLDPQSSALTS
jgi:hypothetical protein